MKKQLIELRDFLDSRKKRRSFYYFEHMEARRYVNKKADTGDLYKNKEITLDFKDLMDKNYKLANLQRLIFIDFLILSI